MCGCGQKRFFTQNRQFIFPQNKNRITNVINNNRGGRVNNRNFAHINFGRNNINLHMQINRRMH